MNWQSLSWFRTQRTTRGQDPRRLRLERLEDRIALATLPAGFSETLLAGGLSSPTAMEFAPDGRVFVAQQNGSLRVIQNGALLPTPFVNLPVNSEDERGLLGITFDPNFATNQYVYVYYTATSPNVHNRISRFTANGNVAVQGSEFVLMDLENLVAGNHNGGAMHFGPDGKLYVAVGENAVPNNSQTLNNRLGKMLRLNSDGTIPMDNPFYQQATGLNRSIWAIGLRNPFTFAFQPGTTRMFINDVGANTWEEINDGIAGSNYGWPAVEGSSGNPNFRDPLFSYGHGGGASLGCAITGGTFYNPVVANFPAEYSGDFFFSDFCSGWIRRFDPATSMVTNFASGVSSPVDLKVTADGSLYYLARGSGQVWRVRFNAPQLGPDLAAVTPAGWSGAIVVSTQTGTNTDAATIRTTDTVYIDWAAINQGDTAIGNTFHVQLRLDGQQVTTFTITPPVAAGNDTRRQDFNLGSLPAGMHTVTLVFDNQDEVSESNEGNNQVSKTFSVTSGTMIDIDDNGASDALTDGVLALRYLFGFRGSELVMNAVDPNGERTNPATIAALLDGVQGTLLDPDANGSADALTDGILIIRHLFGFTGAALIGNALGPGATRTDAGAIAAFLDGFRFAAQFAPARATPTGAGFMAPSKVQDPISVSSNPFEFALRGTALIKQKRIAWPELVDAWHASAEP